MKSKLFFILLAIGFNATAQSNTPPGAAIIKRMYDRYAGKWYSTLTFVQTTEMYRNDSLKRKDTWYEAVKFPDKFRIDFGNISDGNAVVFNGDSSYSFKNGKLVRTEMDANDLNFLLGGLYFYSFGDDLKKLKTLGYDLNKSFSTNWNGRAVFVVGASAEGDKLNQLWIDKEKLVLIRQIKFEDNRKEDACFEDQVKIGKGYTETKAKFYFNEKLIQAEYYHDWKANTDLRESLFDPKKFGEWHWYKEDSK